MLPIYFNQKTRAGGCHHPHGLRTAVAALGSAPCRAEGTQSRSMVGDSGTTRDVPMGHQPSGSLAHPQGDVLV